MDKLIIGIAILWGGLWLLGVVLRIVGDFLNAVRQQWDRTRPGRERVGYAIGHPLGLLFATLSDHRLMSVGLVFVFSIGALFLAGADSAWLISSVDGIGGKDMPLLGWAVLGGVAGIATGGDITVEGANQDDMITFLNTIRRIGAEYEMVDNGIRFYRGNGELRGIELETDTHPGFMTDWQQPMVVLLTQADGLSVIHETVFEDRFGYTEALNAMGANIGVFSKCLGENQCRFKGKGLKHSAIIGGPTPLKAADIEMPDIRAGMAYVIAAMVSKGTSNLTGVDHLIRGYGPQFTDKLKAVGADFTTS